MLPKCNGLFLGTIRPESVRTFLVTNCQINTAESGGGNSVRVTRTNVLSAQSKHEDDTSARIDPSQKANRVITK